VVRSEGIKRHRAATCRPVLPRTNTQTAFEPRICKPQPTVSYHAGKCPWSLEDCILHIKNKKMAVIFNSKQKIIKIKEVYVEVPSLDISNIQ
jgi:hypothetical protein